MFIIGTIKKEDFACAAAKTLCVMCCEFIVNKEVVVIN